MSKQRLLTAFEEGNRVEFLDLLKENVSIVTVDGYSSCHIVYAIL